VEQTRAPSPSVESAAGNQVQEQEPNVTPPALYGDELIRQEETVEYRDEDGNLLNEEEVAALKGKVSFETRYETRTRIVDAAGNPIADGSEEVDGHAPPHPDVDREPETATDVPEDDGREYPATASPEDDLVKEHSVEANEITKPRPANEPREATK
jgi:dolichyl-phosphate-mannose-protein mannosyltransferase